MTPKEKAQDLYRTYIDYTFGDFNCKQCALIAVDEMIVQNGDIYLAMLGDKANKYYVRMNSYLFEVKQELEKL
jgi:hypothetical protein